MLKIQSFEKEEAIFPVKNIMRPIFSRFIECDKPQRTICKGSQAFLTITVVLIGSFFWN